MGADRAWTNASVQDDGAPTMEGSDAEMLDYECDEYDDGGDRTDGEHGEIANRVHDNDSEDQLYVLVSDLFRRRKQAGDKPPSTAELDDKGSVLYVELNAAWAATGQTAKFSMRNVKRAARAVRKEHGRCR